VVQHDVHRHEHQHDQKSPHSAVRRCTPRRHRTCGVTPAIYYYLFLSHPAAASSPPRGPSWPDAKKFLQSASSEHTLETGARQAVVGVRSHVQACRSTRAALTPGAGRPTCDETSTHTLHSLTHSHSHTDVPSLSHNAFPHSTRPSSPDMENPPKNPKRHATDTCVHLNLHAGSQGPKDQTMPEYKLYYYPFAGGRGEALRVALHHSGVEWENVEMPFGDYQALKADDAADVAWKCGLPVLSVDGKLFTQSLAQLRCGTLVLPTSSSVRLLSSAGACQLHVIEADGRARRV
jgi:hypothetical protein